MPMFHHDLKCWPEPFRAVQSGEKTHEVRKTDDRTFRTGERILLREWNPETREYTGYSALVNITYVSEPGTWGLPDNVAVLSVQLR